MSSSYLVFVPGIMGSELIFPSSPPRCIWTDKIGVVARTLLIEPWLLQGTTRLDVGDVLRGTAYGYGALLGFLRASGFIEKTNFTVFAYDWRLPTVWNGQQLAQRLVEIQAERPSERFGLLGHSMGCLVSRAAAITRRANVVKLLELAPPHRGASKSFRQLHQFPNVHPLVDAIGNAVPMAQYLDAAYSAIMRTIGGIWYILPPEDEDILLGPPDCAALAWRGWSENARVQGAVPRARYSLWSKIISGSIACPPVALAYGKGFLTEYGYPHMTSAPYSLSLNTPTFLDGDGTVSIDSAQWLPSSVQYSAVADHVGICSNPQVQSWLLKQIP